MIGAAALPSSVLVYCPTYVPPRSQIVSPACTAAGWFSAVCKSHGLPMLPFPDGEPLGAT
jgi:hypothetical protein